MSNLLSKKVVKVFEKSEKEAKKKMEKGNISARPSRPKTDR